MFELNLSPPLLLSSLSMLLLFPVAWLLRSSALTDRAQLKGRTILITGCDSGYGHSLALHCAKLGMRVFATCLEQGEGWAVLDQVEGITVLPLDITSSASRANLLEQVSSLLAGDGLHCLVNNAAVLVFAEAAWQTEAQVVNQVEVNMVGPLLLTRAFITHLATARGRVINMISNCTTCPLPTLAVYTATKFGLLALSDGMRPEVEKYGVRVVIVNPGDAPFNTALTGGQQSHYQRQEPDLRFSFVHKKYIFSVAGRRSG